MRSRGPHRRHRSSPPIGNGQLFSETAKKPLLYVGGYWPPQGVPGKHFGGCIITGILMCVDSSIIVAIILPAL